MRSIGFVERSRMCDCHTRSQDPSSVPRSPARHYTWSRLNGATGVPPIPTFFLLQKSFCLPMDLVLGYALLAMASQTTVLPGPSLSRMLMHVSTKWADDRRTRSLNGSWRAQMRKAVSSCKPSSSSCHFNRPICAIVRDLGLTRCLSQSDPDGNVHQVCFSIMMRFHVTDVDQNVRIHPETGPILVCNRRTRTGWIHTIRERPTARGDLMLLIFSRAPHSQGRP